MEKSNIIKKWYDNLYLKKGIRAMRSFEQYEYFLKCFDPDKVKGKKLLDIGAGTGYLLKAAHQKGIITYGVDISDEAVSIAKNVSPDSFIYRCEAEHLMFQSAFFDLVTCVGALEHFNDMNKGLEEMLRVAKEDALFCIVVPNSNFIRWKIENKAGTNQQEVKEVLLSLSEWRRLFESIGFNIIRVEKDKCGLHPCG